MLLLRSPTLVLCIQVPCAQAARGDPAVLAQTKQKDNKMECQKSTVLVECFRRENGLGEEIGPLSHLWDPMGLCLRLDKAGKSSVLREDL